MCLQEFTGEGLQQKVDAKQVDAAALAAVMDLLSVADPVAPPQPNYAWIAGPVVGGVAGAVILAGIIWWLHRRNSALPVPAFNAAGTDAAARVRRVADKYSVAQQAQGEGSSEGGTPRSAAQVRAMLCLVLKCVLVANGLVVWFQEACFAANQL